MQPSEITDVLNQPISQELLARDLKAAGPRQAAAFTWPATAAATWATYREALAAAR